MSGNANFLSDIIMKMVLHVEKMEWLAKLGWTFLTDQMTFGLPNSPVRLTNVR